MEESDPIIVRQSSEERLPPFNPLAVPSHSPEVSPDGVGSDRIGPGKIATWAALALAGALVLAPSSARADEEQPKEPSKEFRMFGPQLKLKASAELPWKLGPLDLVVGGDYWQPNYDTQRFHGFAGIGAKDEIFPEARITAGYTSDWFDDHNGAFTIGVKEKMILLHHPYLTLGAEVKFYAGAKTNGSLPFQVGGTLEEEAEVALPHDFFAGLRSGQMIDKEVTVGGFVGFRPGGKEGPVSFKAGVDVGTYHEHGQWISGYNPEFAVNAKF